MTIVLDASVSLAWIFERTDKSEAECAEALLDHVAESIVPWLWHTEISNALLVAERRGVISEAQVIEFLTRIDRLPIATDDANAHSRRDQVMALAREHRLTAYDATYLDLALRENAVLATFDGKLATAMKRAGGVVRP